MTVRTMLDILTVKDIIIAVLLIASGLVEVSKININPWSWIFNKIGKAVNGEVLKELAAVKSELDKTKQSLDGHITMDDERNADMHRATILRFNTELLRGLKHTKEDYNEILFNIDCYEQYCAEHPKYKNNRAVIAIQTIKDSYQKRDFLQG